MKQLIKKFKVKFYCFMYYCTKHIGINPEIPSIMDTIEYIIENKASVSRFGDGEFRWMLGLNQTSFQDDSEEMKNRLCEVIRADENGHINCLPDIFEQLNKYEGNAKMYWKTNLGKFGVLWKSKLDRNQQYFNANITRPYMDYLDKLKCYIIFREIKKIWHNREVVIVEGKYSRLGIGNDLFENAKLIQRIICPSTNAYDIYKEILDNTVSFVENKNKLILIALGPTATILAYDLYKMGYQAIDIGHIDVEYSWFLQKAKSKIPIKNKYVNEASNKGGTIVGECKDSKYLMEIAIDLTK